ncbi:hypothetical protein RZS08_49840, partial [Arthrospira platensis SPKY1]|nr:hypothetical protein [Arthrospira platensis SPKY1]
KLEDELRKTEAQVERYESESEKNARMMLQLQRQIDEEITKREHSLKRVEEVEAERESYRSEVIRVTHMLNHKKVEVESLKKELNTLRLTTQDLRVKAQLNELTERDHGRVLRLQG